MWATTFRRGAGSKERPGHAKQAGATGSDEWNQGVTLTRRNPLPGKPSEPPKLNVR